MNPNCLQNPNFCLGYFCDSIETRGKLFYFCDFFYGIQFCGALFWRTRAKIILVAVVFAFWGLGFIHFVATAQDQAYLGLWDCSP